MPSRMIVRGGEGALDQVGGNARLEDSAKSHRQTAYVWLLDIKKT